MAYGTISPNAEDYEAEWRTQADSSLLRRAVENWMPDASYWFDNAFARLPETIRVNPLRIDSEAVEDWTKSIGGIHNKWYSGPGSSWTLPFDRGGASGDVRRTLIALHETGRITRQESVSMMPVNVLRPIPGEVILDLCASPGSKTTQIAEFLAADGLVVANERSRKRCNLLTANLQRHRSSCVIVVNHDGRHIPRLSGNFGYDAILVDAPCTGSGTTRKNPEVWRQWRPSGGLGLQGLQVGLLNRAVDLLRPGGRIVYSTCSLDPVENEEVICRVLRTRSDVELEDMGDSLRGVETQDGLASWSTFDDQLNPIQDSNMWLKDMDVSILKRCKRVSGHRMNAGGFFLALLRKNGDPENKKMSINLESRRPEEGPQASRPVDIGEADWFSKEFGGSSPSLWRRGKRISIGTKRMLEAWTEPTLVSGGKARVAGRRWKPLKVVKVGCDVSEYRSNRPSRIVESGVGFSREIAPNRIVKMNISKVIELLNGGTIDVDSVVVGDNPVSGGWLAHYDKNFDPLPIWIGGKITVMASNHERTSRLELIRHASNKQ